MKLAIFPLALVFGSLALSAQSAGSSGFGVAGMQRLSGPRTAEAVALPPGTQFSQGCPVAMRLNQGMNGALRHVGKGQKQLVYAASLHLEVSRAMLGKPLTANVKAASVTVHGYDGTPRFELVSPGPRPLPARKMEIRFVPKDGEGAIADFVVEGMVSASWLEVDSLTFANGSVWKPSQGESCTVRPNPFQLIDAGSGAGAAMP